MTRPESPNRRRLWVMVMATLVFLVPALLGFGNKFFEFVALYRHDELGAFTIVPIVNYLLASGGFLLLFLWATMHGMFRDIEGPKYTMLENERRIDAALAGDELLRENTWTK